MKRSIYSYAAEAGLPVGLYLSIMSACLLMSLRIEALPMLLLPLAAGFPVMLGFIMRRISRDEPSYMKISALWLGGIYSVIFGTLICCLLSALYLMFVDPGFIHSYVGSAIESIESSPMASEYAATTALMREAMEAHILPTSMEFVITMGWFTCFAGSMLSLLLAVVIVKWGKRNPQRMPG